MRWLDGFPGSVGMNLSKLWEIEGSLVCCSQWGCKESDMTEHKLESRLPGETSITSDTQMTPPLWQKEKRN